MHRILRCLLVLASAVGPCLACGDDAETPRPAPTIERELVKGGIPTRGASGCEAYCGHANDCAEREGRPLPEGASDCEAACAEGGLYASAPPTTFVCAEEPCGERFKRCSFDAMMRHMRTAEIGVFPRVCEGLCNKLAHCALRQRTEVSPELADCSRACASGGALSGADARQFECVNELCGPPFDDCLRAARDGATNAPENPAP